MQTVNVLGDNSRQFSCLFKKGKLFVGNVWLCVKYQHFVTVKVVKILCFREEKVVAYNLLRWEFVPHIVQSVNRAKVGNTAFGAYSRTAEKYNIIAVVNNLL